jgi:hypothetical protein
MMRKPLCYTPYRIVFGTQFYQTYESSGTQILSHGIIKQQRSSISPLNKNGFQ